MPFFAYRGRDIRGELVEGVLEDADSGAIAGRLFASGVTPLEINTAAGPRAAAPDFFKQLRKRKVAHEEVLLFCRQMYTLLKAGVPIMGALRGLQESAENPTFRELVQDMRENLDGGHELSACLARHPAVFSQFFVSMVRVGEQTGTLEEVFLRLFEQLDFEKFMREQVKAAIRYPLFVVVAMAIAIVIINIFVIPAFAKVYQGYKAELPAITKGLIAFSNFMVTWWPAMLAALVIAILAFRSYAATPAGRINWDRLKLRIPIAGKIVLKATLARFARSFSLALKSGVPAVQALVMVAHTVDNEYVAGRIDGMRDGVERGESISRTAGAAGIYTPLVLQMVAVGEESGALDDMMAEVADMYQREVEYELKTLSSQIEPILIVALGALVLLLALGVFLPMWDLGTAAFGKKG